MSKKIIYITLLFLTAFAAYYSFAQELNNKGKISNQGKIIVKGMLESKGGAHITNDSGLVIIDGNAFVDQDTLSGTVEYISDDINSPYQIIPQLSYSSVIFKGRTYKKFENQFGRSFVSLDTFFTASESVLSVLANEWIFIKGRITHGGNINPAFSYGKMRMEGSSSQNIDGLGNFKILELDNTKGADVVNKGGFKIDNRLELTNGEFRNSKDSNFTMGNGSLIVREGGSLSSEPKAEGQYSVRYQGDYAHRTGGEIPIDTVLADLEVVNTKGLTLTKDVVVNNQATIGSKVYTEPAADSLYELAINSMLDPIFLSSESEIDGTIRRLKVKAGDTLWLNNKYTFAHFADSASLGIINELASRVKPKKMPTNSLINQRAERYFYLSAKDINKLEVSDGINMSFAYGWRKSSDTSKDETHALPVPELVLQNWITTSWVANDNSLVPQTDNNDWAFSSATGLTRFGEYAVGINNIPSFLFRALVLLEGPYRYGSMADDLRQKDLIPTTPPDIYPYNLDPQRPFISQNPVPDSVVDWVVLEFRKELLENNKYYKTCFLKKDGRLVDLDGSSPVIIRDFDTTDDTVGGDFFVVVRHRNHVTIVTDSAIAIFPNTQDITYDFTNPNMLMGKSQALKIVDIDPNGFPKYAMIGGWNGLMKNGEEIIELFDRRNSWDNINKEDYNIQDYDMNGIITTRDYNISWNNRLRFGFLR